MKIRFIDANRILIEDGHVPSDWPVPRVGDYLAFLDGSGYTVTAVTWLYASVMGDRSTSFKVDLTISVAAV